MANIYLGTIFALLSNDTETIKPQYLIIYFFLLYHFFKWKTYKAHFWSNYSRETPLIIRFLHTSLCVFAEATLHRYIQEERSVGERDKQHHVMTWILINLFLYIWNVLLIMTITTMPTTTSHRETQKCLYQPNVYTKNCLFTEALVAKYVTKHVFWRLVCFCFCLAATTTA